MTDTTEAPAFSEQWSADGSDITTDPCAPQNADSVRLREGEGDATCVAEWTRDADGMWNVTGSDYGHRGAFEELNGYRSAEYALSAGREWFVALSDNATSRPDSGPPPSGHPPVWPFQPGSDLDDWPQSDYREPREGNTS